MARSAFIFPGQGSQSVGMLQTVAAFSPLIQKTFQMAGEQLGYDAWQLVTQGPAEQLDKTTYTQPMLLTASVALWRLWAQQQGKSPDVLAGHSLGEYSALVAAQAFSFEEALSLVQFRATYMQEAVPEGVGAMAAVLGLSDELVIQACQQAQEAAGADAVVSAVNFNSPGQVVIAGNKAAVELGIAQAKALGAKRALLLAVSVPSHCALMQPAAKRLAEKLNQVNIKSPKIPVVHNVDAQTHDHPDDIRACLMHQLYKPVQWTRTIQHLAAAGLQQTIECGPGKVLSGLVKRICPEISLGNLQDKTSFDAALSF